VETCVALEASSIKCYADFTVSNYGSNTVTKWVKFCTCTRINETWLAYRDFITQHGFFVTEY